MYSTAFANIMQFLSFDSIFYAVPSGMTKLILSANSPHATRFV